MSGMGAQLGRAKWKAGPRGGLDQGAHNTGAGTASQRACCPGRARSSSSCTASLASWRCPRQGRGCACGAPQVRVLAGGRASMLSEGSAFFLSSNNHMISCAVQARASLRAGQGKMGSSLWEPSAVGGLPLQHPLIHLSFRQQSIKRFASTRTMRAAAALAGPLRRLLPFSPGRGRKCFHKCRI